MTLTIRVILIIVSIITMLYAIRKIRNSQMDTKDIIFWVILPAGLVILSIFPQIAAFFANLIGIYSELNFLFVSFIFVIILKLFSLSVEVSTLKRQIRTLVQEYSIERNENDRKR